MFLAVNHKLYRSPIHPGSNGVNIRTVDVSHRAQASDSGRPGALPRGAGDLNILSNLITPGSLGRSFG